MMWSIIFWIVISAVVGTLLYFATKWKLSYTIIGTGISAAVIFFLFLAAWSIVKQDKLTYNEYWNGYEIQAIWDKIGCDRDGSCHYEYSCDPYQEAHYSTDDEGNVTVSYTTEYHDCPYTTEEWRFSIKTTIDDYSIARNLPTNPDEHRWRWYEDVPDRFPSGVPEFWQQAKNRLDAGKPGPVTKVMQYDNYILASDKTILNQYSDKIQTFKDQGLLPNVSNSTRDWYYADKVYFVGGYTPTEDWSLALSYFNAALGTERQGDLHLVLAQNVYEPDAYITALKAYWTDSTVFNDNTFSKNGILIVLGTEDGQTIKWARVRTGMPVGNEHLGIEVSRALEGARLDVGTVLGTVNGELYTREDGKVKVRAVHGNGLLNRVLWGLDEYTGFTRVSMTANDADDVGSGFGYLADQIEPSEGQQFWINIICGFVVVLIAWLAIWIWSSESGGSRGKSDQQYSWH